MHSNTMKFTTPNRIQPHYLVSGKQKKIHNSDTFIHTGSKIRVLHNGQRVRVATYREAGVWKYLYLSSSFTDWINARHYKFGLYRV